MHMKSLRVVLWLTCMLFSSALWAQGMEAGKGGSREREALRRVQQALRQAQAEQGALQQEKAQLNAENAKLVSGSRQLSEDLERARTRADHAQTQVRIAQGRADQLALELTTAQQALETLREQHANLSKQLQDSQATVTSLRAFLERSTKARTELEARNEQLYRLGVAVVEVYRSRQPAETLLLHRQLLGLDQIRLDNAAELWLDRLEAARWQALEQAAVADPP